MMIIKKLTLLPYKDLTVKNWLFIDLSNEEYETSSFYPEFLQKITLLKLTTKKLTLLKKIALLISYQIDTSANQRNNLSAHI